jgi:hypothetical protein
VNDGLTRAAKGQVARWWLEPSYLETAKVNLPSAFGTQKRYLSIYWRAANLIVAVVVFSPVLASSLLYGT